MALTQYIGRVLARLALPPLLALARGKNFFLPQNSFTAIRF